MQKNKIIHCKTALVKSNLPSDDFVINPYTGCVFGCVYCYADFMRRFSGHINDKWGEFVDIKINIAELLAKELPRLIRRIEKGEIKTRFKGGKKWPTITIGSVTDPYQWAESKYKLTRKCLEILVKNNYQGELCIMTKSALILRDIDLLKKLEDFAAGITITSTDNEVSRLLEKNAPIATARLATLKGLNKAGVKTFAFVGPLLPYFTANKKALLKLFKTIEETWTEDVWIEFLNLTGATRGRIVKELNNNKVNKKALGEILNSQNQEYKDKMTTEIKEVLKHTDLKLWGGQVLDHKVYKNWNK